MPETRRATSASIEVGSTVVVGKGKGNLDGKEGTVVTSGKGWYKIQVDGVDGLSSFRAADLVVIGCPVASPRHVSIAQSPSLAAQAEETPRLDAGAPGGEFGLPSRTPSTAAEMLTGMAQRSSRRRSSSRRADDRNENDGDAPEVQDVPGSSAADAGAESDADDSSEDTVDLRDGARGGVYDEATPRELGAGRVSAEQDEMDVDKSGDNDVIEEQAYDGEAGEEDRAESDEHEEEDEHDGGAGDDEEGEDDDAEGDNDEGNENDDAEGDSDEEDEVDIDAMIALATEAALSHAKASPPSISPRQAGTRDKGHERPAERELGGRVRKRPRGSSAAVTKLDSGLTMPKGLYHTGAGAAASKVSPDGGGKAAKLYAGSALYSGSDRATLLERTRAPKDDTAGKGWFNMEQAEMTPELKRDLQVIRMRNYVDPKRFYKSSDKVSKFMQIGTVQEGTGEFFSARMTNKERKKTLVDELLVADDAFRAYAKNQYGSIQAKKRAGGRAHYKEQKRKRQGNMKWKL